MMSELYRKEKLYFRIVGIRAELLEGLKRSVLGHTVKTASYQDTDHLVCSFEVMPDYNYYALSSFLCTNNIPSDSYGLYMSLVTERDNDGVHLPKYALEFYKLIGGSIDFSFVCIGGDDEKPEKAS